MRITQLDLLAYGPFTGRALSLPPSSCDLHIVYGPNEAGKSSTLRALKAWMFGFPEKTGDNFIHAYDKLLVAGLLTADDGRDLYFQRRKRRKADLLSREGNPLAPEEIHAILPVHDEAVFDSLYGITHEGLIKGGEEILAQKGEVGQALFSAGSGIASLREVMEALDREADALFKPRGSNPEINRALKEYRNLQRQAREASLSSREWHELQDGLLRASSALQEAEQKRAGLQLEKTRCERLLQALPLLALRKELQEQQRALGEVAVLPDDFNARRRQAERELHSLRARQQTATDKLAALSEQLHILPDYQAILAQAKQIEELYQRLGEFKKGMLQDRPKLEGMRIAGKKEAAAHLRLVRRDIDLDQVEKLRPLLGKRKVLALLASRQEAIEQRLAMALRAGKTLSLEKDRLTSEFSLLPQETDLSGLVSAVKIARRAGQIDKQLAEGYDRFRVMEEDLVGKLKRIGLWQGGDIGEFVKIPLPLPETVASHTDRLNRLDQEQKRLNLERDQLERSIAEIDNSLAELANSGDIPTEEELGNARDLRDTGWQLVRRKYIDDEDIAVDDAAYCSGLPLAEAYEKNILHADLIADRLRRESERVHRFASLTANRESRAAGLRNCTNQSQALQAEYEKFENQWQELWQTGNLVPLRPHEMQVWLGNAERLRIQADELQKMDSNLKNIARERDRLKANLLTQLKQSEAGPAPDSDELEPLLNFSENLLETTQKNNEKRLTLTERLNDLEYEIRQKDMDRQDAQDESDRWQQQWQETVAGLAEIGRVQPAEATELMENLLACFAKLNEAEGFKKRIDGIDKDTQQFNQDLQKLTAQLGGLPDTLSVEQRVSHLYSALTQARDNKTRADRLATEIKELSEENDNTRTRIMALQEELAGLCRLARCPDPAGLDGAERASAQYSELKSRISDTEASLLSGAGGLSIAELAAQAQDKDPEALTVRIELLAAEIKNELEPEIKEHSQTIGRLKEQLLRMNGNGQAADITEKAGQVLARIQRFAARYLKLKVASQTLRREVERFRAENQDPVLRIACEYFKKLTLESFSGLRTDEDDRGQPILVGIRSDNSRLTVEQMSSGSRDQLFLALRLASMVWRLGSHESVPCIVDDILVNFDDQRSQATLRLLAEFAAKSQVILFTHHQRIVEEARKLAPEFPVQVHEI